MRISAPHLRHFIRTDRPATFSSPIWYFALQLGQRNFIQAGRGSREVTSEGEYREASISPPVFSTQRAALKRHRPESHEDRERCHVTTIGELTMTAHRSFRSRSRIDCRAASSGAFFKACSHVSTARSR